MANRGMDDLADVGAWLKDVEQGTLRKALPVEGEPPAKAGATPPEPATIEVNGDEDESGPEVDFVPTVVRVFQAWKAALGGGEVPADLPKELAPQAGEKPGAFAARAAKFLPRMPGGREAFAAAGPEPEWTAWVTSIMRYHGDEAPAGAGGEPEAEPDMEKSLAAALLRAAPGMLEKGMGTIAGGMVRERGKVTPAEAVAILAFKIEQAGKVQGCAKRKVATGSAMLDATGYGGDAPAPQSGEVIKTRYGYFYGDASEPLEDAAEAYANGEVARLSWDDSATLIDAMRAKGGVQGFYDWIRDTFLAAAKSQYDAE